MKFLDIIPQLLSGNHFSAEGYHDLGLQPSDLKINRGHLLVVTNLHTKYEVPVPKYLQLLSGNHFSAQGHCDIDLLTLQSIGVIYRLRPTCTPSMKFLGISVLELLSKNHFSAES